MKTYRRIEGDIHFARQVWDAEQTFPEWFRDASRAWHPGFDDFVEFWLGCREIYGLFEDERLIACVMLEYSDEVNVHIAVLERKPDLPALQRFFASVRRKKREEGVAVSVVWALAKNVWIRDIARQCGYQETGLKRDYGQSRGKVLRWIQMIG